MKTLRIICSLLFLAYGTLFSQIGTETFKFRHTLQQQFILKRYLLNNKKPEIKDTLQLDSVFTFVDKAWRAFVKDSLNSKTIGYSVEALNNLDAYSYLWMLMIINNNVDNDKELMFRLTKKYMLPSLMYDVQFVKNNPTLTNLKLIWNGSLNMMYYGNEYFTNSDDFNAFYRLYVNLKELLNSDNDSDNETRAYKASILNVLESISYETQAKYYYFNNSPDLSFTYLITGLSTNKINKSRAILFSKPLIKYYLSVGDKDKSIAILNNLFFSTTSDNLQRDSLFKWYNLVDSINGKTLYKVALNKFSTDYFQVSDKPSIELPARWNLINDTIVEKKIRKASYILIDFWYTACSPCVSEVPKLNALYSFMKDRVDVVFISINADYFNTKKDRSYVNSVAKGLNIEFPIVYDNEKTKFTNQFNVNGYPAKFIVDKQGRIITKNDKSQITLETFYDFLKVKNNR
jgi:hypothetical protein